MPLSCRSWKFSLKILIKLQINKNTNYSLFSGLSNDPELRNSIRSINATVAHDDIWQAINKFSGGDVTIFTLDFKKMFGHYERVDIDTTFRYGNLINKLFSNLISHLRPFI